MAPKVTTRTVTYPCLSDTISKIKSAPFSSSPRTRRELNPPYFFCFSNVRKTFCSDSFFFKKRHIVEQPPTWILP